MDVVEPAVRHDDDKVAVPRILRNRPHDFGSIGDVAGILTRRPQVLDQNVRREPLGFGQRRSKNGWKNDAVGLRECAREISLENSPAGGRRARLEYRPDPSVGICGPYSFKRLANGGRVMREVVVDRHA